MYKNSVHAIIAQIFNPFNHDINTLQIQYHSAMKLITRWLLLAAALLFVAYVYDGVTLNGFQAALIAAFVIGLLNTFVKPLLVILTLPVTIITVGLFLFVINALMFWGAASLLDGFNVTGFKAALIGSLIYSVLSYLINTALDSVFSKN
jgi:putative membrane protein